MSQKTRSHNPCRTVSEWVLGAVNEGFQDLVEWSDGNSASELYYSLRARLEGVPQSTK